MHRGAGTYPSLARTASHLEHPESSVPSARHGRPWRQRGTETDLGRLGRVILDMVGQQGSVGGNGGGDALEVRPERGYQPGQGQVRLRQVSPQLLGYRPQSRRLFQVDDRIEGIEQT